MLTLRYDAQSDVDFFELCDRISWRNPGLGTAFFPVQNVPVFPTLLKNVPFFPVLFLRFWRLMRPKRMGKNAKIVTLIYKERERTQERFVLLQKNARTFCSFSIYIYRYIEKRTERSLKKTLHSFMFFFCEIMTYEIKKNVPFFYKERKETQISFRSFIKNRKENKDRSVLL